MKFFSRKTPPAATPGPQSSKVDANLLLLLIAFLCFIFFLLTLYAVAKDNVDVIYPDKKDPGRIFLIKYTFFDAKTCCTIFITLLSLILVRSHFILGFKPRIIYESRDVNAVSTEPIPGEIWLVQIKNVGLGAAIVESCQFRTGRNHDEFNFTHQEIVTAYTSKDIQASNYFLPNISVGYVFQPKDDKTLFKIKKTEAIKAGVLDMELKFKGLLGGEYTKIIFLLPVS